MRKITLAFGSFILGAISMFLLGNHASTLAQGGPAGGAKMFGNAKFVPIVPATSGLSLENNIFPAGTYGVDGTVCTRCVFNGATLEYGVSEGLRPSRQEKGNGLCGPGRAFSGSQGEVPR
jgi:hypothetical protein